MNDDAQKNPPKDEESISETMGSFALTIGLAVVLLIGGFLFAGYLAETLTPLGERSYKIALCIGMIPFWWFAVRQLRLPYDWYDYGFCFVCVFCADMLHDALTRRTRFDIDSILFNVALVCTALLVWRRLRAPLIGR